MLKYALLTGAMMIAAPVIAQTTTQPAANPAPAGATGTVAPATPATTMDAAPATPQSATASPNATAQAAPAEQPATGNQVAQVVDAEFPTYDTDSNGTLSGTEFAAWMVALKTKSDPATKATSPETKKWNDAAFAQADTDKSKSVSKTELTGFLSKG
jgi:hypothetical protein